MLWQWFTALVTTPDNTNLSWSLHFNYIFSNICFEIQIFLVAWICRSRCKTQRIQIDIGTFLCIILQCLPMYIIPCHIFTCSVKKKKVKKQSNSFLNDLLEFGSSSWMSTWHLQSGWGIFACDLTALRLRRAVHEHCIVSSTSLVEMLWLWGSASCSAKGAGSWQTLREKD